MMKKMWMMILLLGIISVSGCHTAERASIRAGYYDPYPYAGYYYYDPYPRYYAPYPAYYYDPYPYFFFGGSFFFFDQPFVGSHQFVQPRRSLRGRSWSGRSGFSSPGPSFPAPGGAPAPAPAPGGQRNLR